MQTLVVRLGVVRVTTYNDYFHGNFSIYLSYFTICCILFCYVCMPLYAVLAFYYNFYISERERGREREKIEVEGESERKKERKGERSKRKSGVHKRKIRR